MWIGTDAGLCRYDGKNFKVYNESNGLKYTQVWSIVEDKEHNLWISVYGNGLKKQLFWDIYRKSRSSQVITLYGTGAETRDFIHIEDLMQVFDKVLDKAVFNGDAINVASGESYSINEAATRFVTCLGNDFKIAFNGVQQASDPLHWLADISRLSELGFCPNIDLQSGLQQYASWLKELN
jgi:dTDP-glucose 4,6-dehydratase/UDP-glucose 4-epimerase